MVLKSRAARANLAAVDACSGDAQITTHRLSFALCQCVRDTRYSDGYLLASRVHAKPGVVIISGGSGGSCEGWW